MFSLAIVHESRFVVKWKTVDVGDVVDTYSFVQLFDHLKAGLIDGVDEATEWFQNRHFELIGPQQVEGWILEHVHKEKVFVGKNCTDLLMECTPSFGAGKTCSKFGNFVKICVKLEHPNECICENC